METAYVHTFKTNANMLTIEFKGIIPCLGFSYLGLGSGKFMLVSTNKHKTQSLIHKTEQLVSLTTFNDNSISMD